MSNGPIDIQQRTLFGHPTGLFTLFFAEMWERFSYYGMRALLVLYMLKGFLGYGDSDAYAVYGAYTALVYMTPFFGGLIADRLLGARRAVVLGGLLMAAGHLLMTIETGLSFFTALALLIAGNGFFKPNISTMVGSLYSHGNPKRDGGFTIFYMGINLGAAMSPLLCGYIGETFGWHYGFGLATIGMLTGIAVFVMPTRVTQILIMLGAGGAALGLFLFRPDTIFSIGINIFVGIALLTAGITALVALSRGGLPAEAGAPPEPQLLRRRIGGIPAEFLVYIGAVALIPVFMLLVSGFALFTPDRRSITIIPDSVIEMMQGGNAFTEIGAVVIKEMSKPAGLILLLAGVGAFGYVIYETFRLNKIPRQRMYVVLILTFFSMLFWAFFEQAGSSVNLFTDRNVDRVLEKKNVTEADEGKVITFRIPLETNDEKLSEYPPLTQEQLGHRFGNEEVNKQIAGAIRAEEKRKGKLKPKEIDDLVEAVTKDKVFTMSGLTFLREHTKSESQSNDGKAQTGYNTLQWQVTKENVDTKMGIGGSEMPASLFQALNPIYILLFGIVFSTLWTFLATHRMEPSTPVKFSLGLLQLGLGFGVFWYGAQTATDRGMVALSWLFLGYLLHTTGELCISPVGLSMVTKMSPAFLVSTVMGMWFLATAFSQIFAAIIAQFTRVSHGGESAAAAIPVPSDTVHLYGDVFGKVGIAAMVAALVCFLLSPILSRWMHEDTLAEEEAASPVLRAGYEPHEESEHIQPAKDQIRADKGQVQREDGEDGETNIRDASDGK